MQQTTTYYFLGMLGNSNILKQVDHHSNELYEFV